jgi:hypothetical protein
MAGHGGVAVSKQDIGPHIEDIGSHIASTEVTPHAITSALSQSCCHRHHELKPVRPVRLVSRHKGALVERVVLAQRWLNRNQHMLDAPMVSSWSVLVMESKTMRAG